MSAAGTQRIAWLDSLKFLACLAILWGHVFAIFRPGTLAAPVQQAVKACGALEMSCFWVPLFCAISGGLVRYHAGTGLLRALAHRYRRFAVPFAIAGLAIWGWLQILPAETQAYGARLGNDWLATMYAAPPALGDVAAMALVFDAALDPPLWMLRDLFFGNAWVLACGWWHERRGGGRAPLALGACAGAAAGVLGLAAGLGLLPAGLAAHIQPVAVHALLAGATAVQIGAASLADPHIFTKILADLPDTIERLRIDTLSELIGAAHRASHFRELLRTEDEESEEQDEHKLSRANT